MNELFDLSGKIALVTGASRGLGYRFALTLSGAGAQVQNDGMRLELILKRTIRVLKFEVACSFKVPLRVMGIVFLSGPNMTGVAGGLHDAQT